MKEVAGALNELDGFYPKSDRDHCYQALSSDFVALNYKKSPFTLAIVMKVSNTALKF